MQAVPLAGFVIIIMMAESEHVPGKIRRVGTDLHIQPYHLLSAEITS
jgi:hypothetical protein